MKQLRKTEWRRGYPIKKNLALGAWGMLALAGFAGILARPENIPSLAAYVLALAGAGLLLPRPLGYFKTTYQFLPAFYRGPSKKEQEGLLESENFWTITELKSGSLRRTDFAESARWLRINGRYIPKELVILGGAEVTFNIMNRDTTPVIFVYATGDTVKIDLGVQASVQKIRELNAYFRSRYHIFPGQADGKKTEELCSIFREIYTDYLKEKEPEKEDAVLAKLVKDAGELRQKCIEKMPPYLKRGDRKA